MAEREFGLYQPQTWEEVVGAAEAMREALPKLHAHLKEEDEEAESSKVLGIIYVAGRVGETAMSDAVETKLVHSDWPEEPSHYEGFSGMGVSAEEMEAPQGLHVVSGVDESLAA
jgi:ferredoxin-NADP reductase